MNNIWNKIKAWLTVNAPDIHDELNQGATESDFEILEKLTGAIFPDEVKDFYRIHNGQDSISDTLTEMGELLSLERMGDEWRIWKSLLDKNDFKDSTSKSQKGIQANWWHPHWIPITYDGKGNHYCIDLAPSPEGKKGQIITMWHHKNIRRVVAPSFAEWIGQFADDLHAEKYIYSEEKFGIFKKN